MIGLKTVKYSNDKGTAKSHKWAAHSQWRQGSGKMREQRENNNNN